MSLDKLDYILAVAEAQTLTRAANQLYVSQPTLSNYINKLEESLGVKLFDRSVTPIQVTKAGALYIETMKKIQKETDMLESKLLEMSKEETILTIGIGSTRGDHWLPDIIPEFMKKHPDVSIQLFERGEEDLENALLKGNVDVAFGVLNTSFPEIEYQDVIDEIVLLAIPREFSVVSNLSLNEATYQNPYMLTGEDIKDIPFLMPYPGNGFYRTAQTLLKKAEVSPIKVLSYKNMNTAYQLAASGVGAIFITSTAFEEKYPKCKGKLAFCTISEDIHVRTCVAGYKKDSDKIEIINDIIKITKDNING